MITADQIFAHVVGDYVLQSHWMATEKTKKSVAALAHVICYGLPFLFIRPSLAAMVTIICTHFVIDRWRLARFAVYAKNFLAPRDTMVQVMVPSSDEAASLTGLVCRMTIVEHWHKWADCSATGYHKDVPPWLAVWLLIIVDNAMHIGINALALRYL